MTISMLLRGTFVHCPKLGALEILKDWLIAIDNFGCIIHCEHIESPKSAELVQLHGHLLVTIPPGSFVLPLFNDLHLHAPQFLYQGNGLDLPLLEWLHQYAFKAEERLDINPELARKVYRRLGQRLVEAGTGAICLFGTLNAKTNLTLAEEMRAAGIRAFVGKVSMDISSRPSYVEESAEAAIDAVKEFGERIVEDFSSSSSSESSESFENRPPLVQPVITPRFVPTCSDELLHGLGVLAEQKGWRIQSHMAESSDQVEWVRKERGDDDIHIFEKHGLLTSRTIQAHCTFLSSCAPASTTDANSNANAKASSPLRTHSTNQFTHLHTLGTSIAHCPLSNIYFSPTHAFCLREALEAQVKIGLGTDVAGGYSLDIMNAMRSAVAVSRMREGVRQKERKIRKEEEGEREREREEAEAENGKSLAIDWKESLFLATLGGAEALGIESGMFRVGAPFDAQQSMYSFYLREMTDDILPSTYSYIVELFDPNTGIGVGALDLFELEMEMETAAAATNDVERESKVHLSGKDHRASSSSLSEEMVEKWWCVGDQRNRVRMWIQGVEC
ncbi:hypothetical protein GYMLUDRAFT_46417 [Collybiopsis luxurians FD-317 M1]|uniref:Amidohydrolase-related domain-containing protein n=1 Tax=Collybiopsis luxurians FD-317 M1 TaxID=944289 RepID=A0A0D0BQ06_9AGAR|nr:hypothetical protein GYMLUDRAFT_46417 [Collybiopsis luxurians FD-317 M1]